MTLVVDAAPIIALGDASDPSHEAVADIVHAEGGGLVIPALVTAEIDYLIRRRGTQAAARQFLRDVARGIYEVACLTADEHGRVARLDEQYADLDPGLADLSVVVLAHRFKTTRILTFDERDFRTLRPLAGSEAFTILPADR